MNPKDFVYWLQGILDVIKPEDITPAHVTKITKKLNSVFTHSLPDNKEEKIPEPEAEPFSNAFSDQYRC